MSYIIKASCFTFLLLTFLIPSEKCLAQSSEWNLWTGAKVTKQLKHGFSINLNPEFRLSDNFNTSEILMETGLNYEPIKYIELAAKYRYSSLYETDKENEVSHQLAFDLKGKFKYNKFKFQARTRLTNYSDFEIDEYFTNPYLRYKLEIAYKFKDLKITPYISSELFHQLDDKEINKLRTTIGLDYKINSKQGISIEYSLQNYLKKENKINIIAIQYNYKF